MRTRIYRKPNNGHVVLDIPNEEPRTFYLVGHQVKEQVNQYPDGRSVCYYLEPLGVPLYCEQKELISIIRREYRKARAKQQKESSY